MLYFLFKLIVFIIPLYLLRFELFDVPVTALEISIYVLFSAWLLRGGWRGFKDWSKIMNWHIYWPVFLIFFGATLSTIFSRDIIASGGIWKAYFLDPLLFLLVFISSFQKREIVSPNGGISRRLENLLIWFLFSGYAVTTISLAYLWVGNLTYDGRLRAFYQSPNHLAMFLAPMFLVNIYFLFKKNVYINESSPRGFAFMLFLPKFWRGDIAFWRGDKYQGKGFLFKIGLLLTGFALGAVIFFTYSYGAWIGLVGAVSFYIFYEKIFTISIYLNQTIVRFRYINRMVIMIITGLVLAGMLSYIIFNLPSIADYFDATGRSSLHSRIIIWQSSLEMLKNNPILGIGPGIFQEYYLEYQKYFPPYLEWAVPQPHNIFLAFWLQTGIIGLIGFLWLSFSLLKFLIYNSNSLAPLVLSFLMYFLIHGLVDTIYWKNDLVLIFWFFAGMALITTRIEINKD